MQYELYHHGILGMKWGIRRYQNPDGTLTPAGRKRYGVDEYTGEYVKKSKTTRAFEKLAESGYKNEKKQQQLYKKTGNQYHKDSAEKWKKEADANSSNAKESFKNDATKKLRPELYRKQKEWDKNYQEHYIDNYMTAYNKTADYANNVLIPMLDKKYGVNFDGFDDSTEANKAYNKEIANLMNSYMSKTMDELFGKRPTVDDSYSYPTKERKRK